MNIRRALIVAVALSGLTAYAEASSQSQAPSSAPPQTTPARPSPSQPQGSPSQQLPDLSQATLTFEGELTDVDVKTNMLTIKPRTGQETKFKYDDQTKVTGGQKGVAGLATMAGSQVTLQYHKDGQTNMVTSIQVRPSAPASPRVSEPSPRPLDPARPSDPIRDSDPSPRPDQPR